MKRRTALMAVVVCILAAQAISSNFLRRQPFLPSPPPLANLPLQMGGWSQVREQVVDPQALEALGPDDFLVRLYRGRDAAEQADLFIAYYKTQLQVKAAHDPKVCLPGAGWNPTESHLESISPRPGLTFPVNYYRIKRNGNEEVVLYWFQTPRGVYTYEQQLKAHRVWDAIVDNRTDMALVRIIVPVTAEGPDRATSSATQLAGVVYNQMLSYFPATEKAGS